MTACYLQVGKPYELHPRSLDTLGESDLDGQIGARLAGHYRLAKGPDGSDRCVAFSADVSSHLGWTVF